MGVALFGVFVQAKIKQGNIVVTHLPKSNNGMNLPPYYSSHGF